MDVRNHLTLGNKHMFHIVFSFTFDKLTFIAHCDMSMVPICVFRHYLGNMHA